MKKAIEGIYHKGKIIPEEEIDITGDAKVLIVFLDEIQEDKKNKLIKTFGSWEDDRSTSEIISDIYNSRKSREDNITL